MPHGKIAEVKSFDRGSDGANVTVDPGGGALLTAAWFEGSGDDSQPLPGDFVALDESTGAGTAQTTGAFDPVNAGQALPGEKRLYSRKADGSVVGEVWLKNDGSLSLKSFGANPITMTFEPASGAVTLLVGTLDIQADTIKLGKGAGKQVACVGDLVAVTVPQLLSTTPGNPVVPVPPTAVTATGGYVAAGQIISGRPAVKA